MKTNSIRLLAAFTLLFSAIGANAGVLDNPNLDRVLEMQSKNICSLKVIVAGYPKLDGKAGEALRGSTSGCLLKASIQETEGRVLVADSQSDIKDMDLLDSLDWSFGTDEEIDLELDVFRHEHDIDLKGEDSFR